MKKYVMKTEKWLLRSLVALFLLLMAGCSARMDLVKNEPPDLVPPPIASAPASGSLWPGENAKNMLFVANKARRVNDIVTILVSEASVGTTKASTNTSRDSTTAAGVGALLGLEKSITNGNDNMQGSINIGGTSSNSLKGAGDTSRTTALSAKLTARVLKVLENGNLFIEGRRQLTMNGEDQYVVISGTIRPDDISNDNYIASQSIADARIYYSGAGVINDKMQPGWLTRVVDAVWPF
jgi:flagellar L-ring protein precursor FlgH